MITVLGIAKSFYKKPLYSIAIVGLFIIALFGNVVSALVQEKSDCTGIKFTEARSLGDLPIEVIKLLARQDSSEMSDRGGKFNAGDVGGGPFRRFALAAVSKNRILIAIEHGGRGYRVELWGVERTNDGWHIDNIGGMHGVPNSTQEIAEEFCR